jgi:hypothetical protein
MDKRYQVFVSSTYEDLREERNEVMHALLELDCIPSGMELFPAADEDQWTLIKEVIDDCDYYVVIISGRYGSVHPSGKSYTQMEYEYALSKNKPTIAFLHENPAKIPAGKTEPTDEGKKKLEAFRQLAQSKHVKNWSSAADLGSKVSRSISQLVKRHPAIGWVRANEAVELAGPEILQLRRRIDELQTKLNKAGYQPPEGSDQLAQGRDEFRMNFDVELADEDDDVMWETIYFVDESWNLIFAAIAPQMIDKADESELRHVFGAAFKETLEEVAKNDSEVKNYLKEKKSAYVPRLHHARLVTADLKTVIVQLRALGLIARDDRKRNPRDTATYWTLTPLGDQTMTRLRAIHRDQVKHPKKSTTR